MVVGGLLALLGLGAYALYKSSKSSTSSNSLPDPKDEKLRIACESAASKGVDVCMGCHTINPDRCYCGACINCNGGGGGECSTCCSDDDLDDY